MPSTPLSPSLQLIDKQDHDEHEPMLSTNKIVHVVGRQRVVSHAEDINHDLNLFADPFWKIPALSLLIQACLILRDTLSIVASLTGPLLITTSGYIYLNMVGHSNTQASFGLFNTLFMVFFVAVLYANMDKLGITISVGYGEQKYDACKKYFVQGLLTVIFIFLFVSLPIMMFSRQVLVFANIEHNIAREVSDIAIRCVPLMIIQVFAEPLKTYCMAQGQEQIFGTIGLFNLLASLAANYYLMVVKGWGVHGWIITKSITEIINLLAALYTLNKCHPDTRNIFGWHKANEGYYDYFVDSIKFTAGSYSEFFGTEMISYFVALIGDTNQIAAYFSILNFSVVIYSVGMSFSIICRTRINIFIGMGKVRIAKNYYTFFVAWVWTLGLMLCLLFIAIRRPITDAFASSTPEMERWFDKLLFAYSCFLPFEMILCTTVVGIKTIGKIATLLVFTLVFFIGGNFCTALVVMHWHGSCLYYLLSTYFWATVMNLLALTVVLASDWSLAKPAD